MVSEQLGLESRVLSLLTLESWWLVLNFCSMCSMAGRAGRNDAGRNDVVIAAALEAVAQAVGNQLV